MTATMAPMTGATTDEAKPHRVLVAEDEALIRLDLVEMLREEGYEVVGEAGDGQEAVELAESLKPDLVIMDVKMPRRDGIDAASEIAANPTARRDHARADPRLHAADHQPNRTHADYDVSGKRRCRARPRGQYRAGRAEPIRAVVWFSDLVGFTRIADAASADAVLALLNDYAEAQVEAIEAQGGHVLKFIGDAILAIFPDADTARACKHALEAAAKLT